MNHQDQHNYPDDTALRSTSTSQQASSPTSVHHHTNIIHIVDHPKSILPHLPNNLPPENDEGYREYKLKLLNLEPKRIKHLITQMKFRIMEGGGEAIYEVGVADDGTPEGLVHHEMQETLANIHHMTQQLKADYSIVSERVVHANPPRRILELSVKQKALETYLELNTIFVAACFVVDGENGDDQDDTDFACTSEDDEFEAEFASEFAYSLDHLQYNMESCQELYASPDEDEDEDDLFLHTLFSADLEIETDADIQDTLRALR